MRLQWIVIFIVLFMDAKTLRQRAKTEGQCMWQPSQNYSRALAAKALFTASFVGRRKRQQKVAVCSFDCTNVTVPEFLFQIGSFLR